ncbi:MAG: hypothetical protein MI741_09735 [Rhodospirillales bacterium]|nr:hypothetical protein [Rhodospirillales bacterium]
MKTLVYQSFRDTNRPVWIETCLASVRAWAETQAFDYRFFGDGFLDLVPDWYREKSGGRLPIITDLARLLAAREQLDAGYRRVIWLDADVLVFRPEVLRIDVAKQFAFGREIWVQRTASGRLRAYRNVHNAVCVFLRGNSFLDFYIHACQSVVSRLDGGVPQQIVGPKLLTSLHNSVGFQLIDAVAMFSPLVVCDILTGGGPALDLLLKRSDDPIGAANLCASLAHGVRDGVRLNDARMAEACRILLAKGLTSA